MIGFIYEGYFYCANVHKYRHAARLEYHVTVLTTKSRPDIPSAIILENRDQHLVQISRDAVPSAFLDTILKEIEKHNTRIH